jgi:hypothetical protein
VNETLPDTLKALIRSGDDSNPALKVLVDDYARYHLALVIVGGLFLAAIVVLTVIFWRRFRRAPRSGPRKWTFEKKTYFWFGALGVLVSVLLAVIVAANVSTVVSPRQGFSGSIGPLGSAKAGSPAEALQASFDGWLQSGSPDVPELVQASIDDRLSWQRPKAIICSVLLLLAAVLSAGVWRLLIRRSRARAGRWTLKDAALLLVGVVMVGTSLLLMLMVMGNTQASLAPISLTMFYG